MSTRACYTFKDDRGSVHVYKHHDGYPYASDENSEAGGLVWINEAKPFAWPLPRFEANEFAASFVRAHKTDNGGVRLINTKEPWEFSSDSEFWYHISCVDGQLYVSVYAVSWWEMDNRRGTLVMEGPLDELLNKQRSRKEVA